MERDQKKRTRAVDGGSGGHRKKEKGKETENESVAVVPAPTEDEVDEFFAILRRMRTAVKYFEKGKLSDPSPETVAADDDNDVNKKRTDGALLDLNSVPDDRE